LEEEVKRFLKRQNFENNLKNDFLFLSGKNIFCGKYNLKKC